MHDDICSFLGDFDLQVEYQIPGDNYGNAEELEPHTIRFTRQQWEKIADRGGAEFIRKWAERL